MRDNTSGCSRRELFLAAAGGALATMAATAQSLRSAPTQGRAQEDVRAGMDLQAMVGLQSVKAFPARAFVMKCYTPPDASQWRKSPGMAAVDEHRVVPAAVQMIGEVNEGQEADELFIRDCIIRLEGILLSVPLKAPLTAWRDLAAHTLLTYAPVHLMSDARVSPTRGSSCWPAYEHTERTTPHILAIRGDRIALATQRGLGNTLVGCREGLAALKFSPSTPRHREYQIVAFKTGHICPEPFVLLGYVGRSPFDAGLVLAADSKGNGAFANNCAQKYWTRLI